MKDNNFNWVLEQCKDYSKEELIEEIYYKCEQIEGKNKKIDQLTNNWNELEEWLKQRNDIGYSNIHTLNKMKEIKENK